MHVEKAAVVAGREYLARVKTRGFWISTVALPVLLGAMFIVPALLMTKTRIVHRLVVVDETGEVGPAFVERLDRQEEFRGRVAHFEARAEEPGPDPEAKRKELNDRVLSGEIHAWIWITRGSLDANRVEYHARSISNFLTQAILERQLSDVVRRARVADAGLDPDRVDRLVRRVELSTVRVTEKGGKKEGAEAGIILATAIFFLLYVMLLIYGQQVMHGVLEEKTSRVVEVVVSSLTPFELMMGKLVGIGLVGLTQIAVWMGFASVLTAPSSLASLALVPSGVDLPTVPPALMAHCVLFFLLGYFVFSTLYAAIGAAFNNAQEAQQFAGTVAMFLIVPALLFWPVLNDPDSGLATVVSLVPIFSPLLMLLRIAAKAPPAWQVALSYALTLGFTVFMIWVCGRIYRVGILMYGKKPTLGEILRWVRYS